MFVFVFVSMGSCKSMSITSSQFDDMITLAKVAMNECDTASSPPHPHNLEIEMNDVREKYIGKFTVRYWDDDFGVPWAYVGTVVSVDVSEDNTILFHIHYTDDEDSEDLELDELTIAIKEMEKFGYAEPSRTKAWNTEGSGSVGSCGVCHCDW